MIVTDGDYDGDDHIDTVIIRATGQRRSTFTSYLSFSGIRSSSPTSTVIRYKLVCDANYYNTYCTVHCVAQDTTSGHYTCNVATGAKKCNTGYSGTDCDIGKFYNPTQLASSIEFTDSL